MRFLKKLLAALLPGAAVGAIAIALSQLILRNLGEIVRWVGGIAQMKESDVTLFSQILGQLRDAEIVSPWLPVLLICCGVNVLIALLIHRGKLRKFVLNVGLCLLLVTPFALWFTYVNGVMLGDMIPQLIPILESGLL